MLSLDNGRPVSKIEGGKLDKKIIYITEEEGEGGCMGGYACCEKCDCKKCIKRPCCKHCEVYFGKGSDNLERKIILKKGKMIPLPNIDTREVVYIAGPSGSGKSTYAANYIKIYKKIFPKNPIIIFSRKDSDPVLDELKPSRFIIDESIVDEPIDIIKELDHGACILFDDCNTFQDEKIKKAVAKLMHDILEIGRSANIYCVVTSHLINPNERKDARTIWNEAHTVTIFPKSGNRHGMTYALKNYCGFDNKQINEILSLPSRWVTIGKQYPLYVLHERGIELI